MWILGKGVVTDVPRFPEEGGGKKNNNPQTKTSTFALWTIAKEGC